MYRFFGRKIVYLLTGASVAFAFPAFAEEDISQLRQHVEELDQKIRALQRQRELDKEAVAESSKEAARVTAGKDGFYLKSGDGACSLRLGGVVQADTRWYSDRSLPVGTSPDNILVRKARPIVEAVVAEKVVLRIMPDFGSSQTFQEGYVEARLSPAFNIRAGKYKSPVGLERLQLDIENEFIERALPTNLAPNRDVGIQVAGSVLSNTVSYQLGLFDGVFDNGLQDSDNNNAKDVVGRIFLEPLRNSDSALKKLGFGVSYSAGRHQGSTAAGDSNLPQFKTMGQQNFFTYNTGAFADGIQERFSPQFYCYIGPFGLLGEHIKSRQVITRSTNLRWDIANRAWQLAGYWVLTGEDASFRGVANPNAPFNANDGQWGAFELVMRYSVQTNDDNAFVGSMSARLADLTTSARRARESGAGLNWYLNRSVKVQSNYEETRFDGGAVNSEDREPEKVFLTRFQVAF